MTLRSSRTTAGALALSALLLGSIAGCGGRGDGQASGEAALSGSDEPAPTEVAADAPAPAAGVPAPPAEIAGGGGELAPAGGSSDEEEVATFLQNVVPIELTGARGREASFGPAAPEVAESRLRLRRDTPAALVSSVLDAIEARDAAALARAGASRSARPRLDADDLADARRRFLSAQSSAYWSRVGGAIARGAFREERVDDTHGKLHVDVGGAAATFVLKLHQEPDGWYLDD